MQFLTVKMLKEIKKNLAVDRLQARERIQFLINKRGGLERELAYLKQGETTRDGGGQSFSLET